MELVYLWVKDYKNIKNQGFNFSPRFHCEYNDKTKELTINENDDYIPDFFGKNINITAIVGKNGSGKSSVLKILTKYINNILQRKEPHSCGSGKEWTENNEYYIDEKILIIFYSKKDEKFYYQSSFKFQHSSVFLIEESKYLSKVSFPLFDYSLTYDKEISKMDEVYPKKYHVKNNQRAILFDVEHSRNIENIIKNYFYLKDEFHDKFKDFFEPKEILLSIDLTIAFESDIWVKNEKELSFTEISELSDEKSNKYIEEYFRKNPIGDITTEELSNKVSNIKISNLLKKYLKKYPEQKNTKIEKKENYTYTIFKIDIDKLNYDKDEKYKKINESAYLDEESSYISCDESEKDYQELIKNYSFLEFSSLGEILEEDFNIDLKDEENNKLYNDLSFGEQQLINILNQIYSIGVKLYDEEIEDYTELYFPEAYEQIYTKYFYQDIKNFIILLDEIDIGFHPDWQKRTIQYIIDFLSHIPDKNFHLIFTTHSPFLLSDIPKENILFLDSGKQVDGLIEERNKKEKKQTFGANIHTLLSDSFFMEDGLMGEFARGKITEIKEFYQKVEEKKKSDFISLEQEYEKKKTKFKQIQSIIGEPFLKTVIKNYLDDLEILFSDDNTLIDKELAEIEKRRVYLEGLKSDKT